MRLHTHGEPLERDLTTYAYVAHRMLAGDSLYETVWDHKPPAVYLAFALFELVFGYGQTAITALALAVASATLVAIFLVLRRISGRPAAWVGAAIFAVASGSTALEANQPNVEVFLNAATAWALVAVAGGRFAAAGVALAIGSAFKINFVFMALPFAWLALFSKPRLRSVAALAIPGITLWAAIAAYFIAVDRFEPFFDAVFRFNWAYSEGFSRALARLVSEPAVMVPTGVREMALTWAIACAWILAAPRATGPLTPGFFRASFIATLMAVITPGHFHPHYFQLWLPLLSVAGALGVVSLGRAVGARAPIANAAVAVLALLLVADLAPDAMRDLRRSPRDISIAKYGTIFVDAAELGRVLGGLSAPDDLVYEWGSETGIYFYSKRRCAASLCFLQPLSFGDDAEKNARKIRLRDEVERAKPRFFVWARFYGMPEGTFFEPLLREHYRRVGALGEYDVYERIA